MLGDLNRWFKGVMYEGSSRIPLLMKAPPSSRFAAQFNRGQVIGNIVESIDVMPTLCEMAGVPLPSEGIQGRSMTKLVSGSETDWKNCAFAERNSRMIRTPQYKLIKNDSKAIRRGGSGYELYDLTEDPQEEHDLASDPAHATVVKELAAKLEAWEKDNPPVPGMAGVPLPPKAGASDRTTKPEKKAGRRKRAQ